MEVITSGWQEPGQAVTCDYITQKMKVLGVTAKGPDANTAPDSVQQCPALLNFYNILKQGCFKKSFVCVWKQSEMTTVKQECEGLSTIKLALECSGWSNLLSVRFGI